MKKSFLTGLALAAGLLASTGSAWATTAKTAANTQIVNTATINFTIGTTSSSASASVAVTVSLIPSAPQVSISNPAPVAYTGTDSPVLTDTLTITSTANGPATYNIAAGINASVNNNNTASVAATTTSITLGASVTSQATTTSNVLYVPSVPYTIDAANNSATKVNGLAKDATVVFTDQNGNPQTATISAVSNPGTPTGTATITLAAGTYSVSVGTPIYEQTSSVNGVNINVKPGSIAAPGTLLTVDVKADVSGSGFSMVTVKNSDNPNAGGAGTPTNLNVWTSAPASVSITKYVRNTSNGSANPAAYCTTTITGTTGSWCTSGVTGKSSDILEYAVIAKNSAPDATGNLANCNITDLLPPSFVTLACNGYNPGNDVNYIDTLGIVHTLQACGYTSGQWANWNPAAAAGTPNLLVYVGNGAGINTPGILPFGQQVVITYKATIK